MQRQQGIAMVNILMVNYLFGSSDLSVAPYSAEATRVV
jgi:hypothetical protein